MGVTNMQVEVLDAPAHTTLAPYEQEIREMLCSGWTPARVVRFIKQARTVDIAIDDVSDYLIQIPKEDIVDFSALQRRYKNLDLQVDAMGELARVLRLVSDRLASAVHVEDMTKTRLAYVDTATQLYWRMLVEFAELQQSLGDLPSIKHGSPPVPHANIPQLVGGGPLPTLRALLIEVSDGAYAPRPRVNTRRTSQELFPS